MSLTVKMGYDSLERTPGGRTRRRTSSLLANASPSGGRHRNPEVLPRPRLVRLPEPPSRRGASSARSPPTRLSVRPERRRHAKFGISASHPSCPVSGWRAPGVFVPEVEISPPAQHHADASDRRQCLAPAHGPDFPSAWHELVDEFVGPSGDGAGDGRPPLARPHGSASEITNVELLKRNPAGGRGPQIAAFTLKSDRTSPHAVEPSRPLDAGAVMQRQHVRIDDTCRGRAPRTPGRHPPPPSAFGPPGHARHRSSDC